jgi:hypothetical protein
VYNYLKYNESNTPKKGILFNLKVNKKKGVFDIVWQMFGKREIKKPQTLNL